MASKPCIECGAPKRPGHPRWCEDCYLWRKKLLWLEDAKWARACRELTDTPRPPREAWPFGHQWCGSCFRFRRDRWFGKGATQCRPCVSMKSHESRVQREFGLKPGQYETMMEAQDGKCAVCRRGQKTKRLAVHHSHDSGRAIALLCQRCNHDLLGAAFDSADVLLCAYAVQIGGWEAVQQVLAGGLSQLYSWLRSHPGALTGTRDEAVPF